MELDAKRNSTSLDEGDTTARRQQAAGTGACSDVYLAPGLDTPLSTKESKLDTLRLRVPGWSVILLATS